MKHLLSLLALATVLNAAAQESANKRPLPLVNVKNAKGETVNTGTFDNGGKPFIIDFWATWCSPCVASMPHTQEVAAKYASQGVAVLAVCTGDKRSRFADWVRLKSASYPAMRFTFDPHEQGTPEALFGQPQTQELRQFLSSLH